MEGGVLLLEGLMEVLLHEEVFKFRGGRLENAVRFAFTYESGFETCLLRVLSLRVAQNSLEAI